MSITRRKTLQLLASACAVSFAPLRALAAAAPGPSLDMLARAKGMRFGSAMGAGRPGAYNGSFADADYRALMAAECGVMTPENQLKWGWLRKDGPDTFDFEGADRLLAFAEANSMGFRGHTLLWHHPNYVPDWASGHDFGADARQGAERLIATHIETVCRRYGERIASYDVVNEAIDEKTGEMRRTAFSPHLAPHDAVELAFRTAREAAPHADLVYNDYTSWEPGNAVHRAAVLALLERFRARGVPVDALGIQAHIGDPGGAKDQPFGAREEGEWRRFLDAVTAMGYRLLITELDVSDKKLPAPVPARDAAIADYARAFLDVTLSYPQLSDVVVWGLSDQYSWLRGLTPRDDGELKRPAPYSDTFEAKPLRTAIADAFRAAPARPPAPARRR